MKFCLLKVLKLPIAKGLYPAFHRQAYAYKVMQHSQLDLPIALNLKPPQPKYRHNLKNNVPVSELRTPSLLRQFDLYILKIQASAFLKQG